MISTIFTLGQLGQPDPIHLTWVAFILLYASLTQVLEEEDGVGDDGDGDDGDGDGDGDDGGQICPFWPRQNRHCPFHNFLIFTLALITKSFDDIICELYTLHV